MNFTDKVSITGEVNIKTYQKRNGNLYLLEDFNSPNTVLNTGRTKMAYLLAGEDSGNYVSQIGFGSNGTTPTVNDTALTDIYEKSIDSYTYSTATSVTFSFFLDIYENNGGYIREYGLITGNDELFARVIKTEIYKKNDIYISGTWKITFI